MTGTWCEQLLAWFAAAVVSLTGGAADDRARPSVEVQFVDVQFVDTTHDRGAPVAVLTADGPLAFPLPATAVSPERVAAPHHDYPAVDLSVPTGTPVFAPATAVVSSVTSTTVTWYEPEGGTCDPDASPCEPCGVGVRLRDAAGWQWSLCHLEHTDLVLGDAVVAGQLVGRSGNTGHSSGPHLHVGLRAPDGGSVCPQPALSAMQAAELPPALVSLPVAGCTA